MRRRERGSVEDVTSLSRVGPRVVRMVRMVAVWWVVVVDRGTGKSVAAAVARRCT